VKWLAGSSKIGLQTAQNAARPMQRWPAGGAPAWLVERRPSGLAEADSNTQSSLVSASAAARSWVVPYCTGAGRR